MAYVSLHLVPSVGTTVSFEQPLSAVETRRHIIDRLAMPRGSLLLVDDDRDVLESTADFLRETGYRVETAANVREARGRVNETEFDVVLCDLNLPDETGMSVLECARRQIPKPAFIMLTGGGSISNAVEAMRAGATDYLTKPFIEDELNDCLEQAIAAVAKERSRIPFSADFENRLGLDNIVGSDWKMQQLFETMETVADSKSTVLILGESGTGKSLTARAIHQLSSRSHKPFVEVACGALSDSLLESELFGHVAGSFTGATQNRPGKFQMADGGTIFLDEIGTASPQLQVKLLRVLQEREFEPVGGTKTSRVDVRVILATNCNLAEKVRLGEFRQDLFYRINVITLEQPPLRDRRCDVSLLAEHHRRRLCDEMHRPIRGFTDDAIAALLRYSWPGNVRELVNVVERAVVLCKCDWIDVQHLPVHMVAGNDNGRSIDFHLTSPTEHSVASSPNDLRHALSDPERKIILDSLNHNGWNRQATAAALGINRTTLYKKMKRLGLGEN